MPENSASDRIKTHSSFAQAVNIFRHRSGRSDPRDQVELFEKIYIGLYHPTDPSMGDVSFFDVEQAPPREGSPSGTIAFEELIRQICLTYDKRNKVSMRWEDARRINEPQTVEELEELQEEQEEDEEIF